MGVVSKSARRLVRGDLASLTRRSRRRASRSSHSAASTSARKALWVRRCLAAASAIATAWSRTVGRCRDLAAACTAASAAGSDIALSAGPGAGWDRLVVGLVVVVLMLLPPEGQ